MTLIAARYQPLESPRAGMPVRARDLHTAQTVLLRELSLPAESLAGALSRAQTAQGIFHPSLLTLFEASVVEGTRLLLAYEFVPAQTVAEIGGGHAFNARRAAGIVSEIADAVAELHARDVAHGGISTATVLVTLKGKAKLDRVADPTITSSTATAGDDLKALGELLAQLVGRPVGAGIPGLQALEVIINRARAGKFESAATLAAMLRRV